MATQPTTSTNQTITLPEGQSTALSFATSDVKAMQLGEGGSLIVTLNDGHTLTVANFSNLAQHGDTLSLQDGATIDAHQLMDTLAASLPAGQQPDNASAQAAPQPRGPIGQTDLAYVQPGLINIVEPGAGKKVEYDLAPGEKYNLAFNPAQVGAHAHIAHGALIITFNDQGEVVLKNIGGVIHQPAHDQPQIAYDGKSEPLSDFLNEMHVGGTNVAQNDNNNEMDAIAQQLAGEQPAGGPAPFGGVGGSADFGSVVDAAPFLGINPLGPIDPTALNYQTPDYQLPIYPFFGTGPEISVGGGFEIGPGLNNNGISEPDIVVKENSFLTVPIAAALGQHSNPSDYLVVTVTGIPGANIGTFSAASGTYNAATGTWSITLAPGQNLNTTFTFTPAHDSDFDFGSLHATATQVDPASGQSVSASTNFYVTVDAVAQAPDITTQNAAEEAGHTTNLNVGVKEVDPSGTETITNITISGVPAGATLNHGTYNASNNTWTLTQNDLTGLTISSTKGTTPGDYVLTVSATSTDTNLHGKEVDFSDNQATSTQTLNLTITPNSIPVITSTGITPGGDDIYEHNLTPTTSVTDQVIVNYGTDGAGASGVTANNTFSETGAAHLTENGQAVTVTEVGNTYTGTADGHTVFTLGVQADGHYTFTLDGPLDNTNGAPITLNFGVTATDNDGDTASGTIAIVENDDVPVAHNDINTFFSSTGSAMGNVISGAGDSNAGGADTLSHDGNNHITQIAFGATVETVTAGTSTTIDGKYGDLTINADGSYTYTLNANSGAGGSGSTTDTPHVFTGNSFPTDLTEGQPLSAADQAAIGELHSNMVINANTVVSGEITFDGAGNNNSLGAFTIGADGTLQSVQLIDGNINTGEGSSPNVGFNIGASANASELGFFLIGNGGNLNNFSNINLSTGSLSFVYDYGQGDQRAATINDGGSHVSLVYTDSTGHASVLAGDIFFTSDRGGSNALNSDGLVHTVSGVDSTDASGQTLKIGFEDLSAPGTDKDYNDTEFTVKLTDQSTAPPTGTDQFTYTLTDNDGSSSQATLSFNPEGAPTISVNGGPPATTGSVGINEPDAVVKENSSIALPISAHLGAGAPAGDYLTVVVSGLPGATVGTVTAPGGVYDAAHNTLTFMLAPGQNLNSAITFTPAHNSDYDFGQLTATVTQTDPASGTSQTANVGFYVTTDAVAEAPAVAAQNATEEAGHTTALTLNVSELDSSGTESITAIKLSGLPAGVTLNHGTLNSDGSYTLTQSDLNKLTVTSQKDTPIGQYQLTLSATSSDTNLHGKEVDFSDNSASASTTATLTITANSVPVITSTGITPGGDQVLEHNLTPTTTVTDQVIVNYGADAAGAAGVAANGTFTATGVSALTEDGHAVTVTETGNTYTGTADGHTVFTLAVGADGHYSFTLDGALDNANGAPIALNFGVTATDNNGDSATGTITIKDIDDAPVAHNDVNTVLTGHLTATGNVVTGAGDTNTGGADYQSKDAPTHVTSVAFDGHSVAVPTTGTATIDGKNGDLTISADGTYTYTLNHVAGSTYSTDHVFTGNSFPTLTEGQAISTADQADLGELHSNMAINANTQVSGAITFDGAAYANSLGAFTINSSGQLQSVQMIDSNIAGTVGSNPNVNFNIGASANASELGFFLIGNGGTLNNFSNIDLAHGSLSFVYDYGQSDQRTATINDGGSHVSLIYTSATGHSESLAGDIYFTTDRGGSNALNSDGLVHTISGVDSADASGKTLQIGFEDLPAGGTDKDYNDTEFTVKLTDQTVACGCGDTFQYTETDADGSSSTANLQLTCAPTPPTTSITVDAGAHCAFVNHGNDLYLPIHITTAGDGSQALTTITVTGVGAEWTVGNGWTAVAGHAGEYELTLPAGTQSYDGSFALIPTGNTTADESDLVFTATVSDNGQTATSTADINVGTLEAPALTVPSTLNWLNYAWSHWSEPLSISGSTTGTHEVVQSITINLNNTFTGLNPNHWSLADMGATLNEGTQTSHGVWTINVDAQNAASALAGLKIEFPGGSFSNPGDVAIHPNPTPDYHDTVIQVTETVLETLSCGCTDTVSVTKGIDVDFGLTPLVVDLTGHGFNLTTNANGVQFDMTGDGTKEQTSWIGAGTGLLCIDLNHNGTIDSTNELFGKGFTSGFSILAQYDTNHDNVINAGDAVFNQLMIWTDTNHDGISQASELHSLSSLGISAISLATTSNSEVIGDSMIGQTATVTWADGHTTLIGDAYFNVSDPQMAGSGIREDGTIGNDILIATASGNDTLAGHGGNDTLIGGNGADTFLFDAINPNYTATVENFNTSTSKIDLSALLSQYNPLQASIDNFVHATAANGNTVISVDASGSGKAADFVNVAVLHGVTGVSVDELVAHHQLIAHAA